jgi:hypothetical protein
MSSLRSRSEQGFVRLRYPIVMALVVLVCGASAANAAAIKYKPLAVEIVTQGAFPPQPWLGETHYFHKIQEAVNATSTGDWVLVEPGVYNEEVRVENNKKRHEIWIRGMNRNTVILNGEPTPGKTEPCERDPCTEGRNGIDIIKVNEVFVENLTVANFNRSEPSAAGGNEIWWNGGDESKKVGAYGWWGQYLTAYDTGLDGGYGIFTNNEVFGAFQNVYASGFNDSGLYLGACQECEAHIDHATIENNALGYSGSNAGGSLTIENSTFRHNSTGIAPNSENPGDGPPPQDGECNRVNPKTGRKKAAPNPTPTIESTEIARCTIIRNNVITENNNLNAPDDNSTGKAPWGAGVELPGDYADLIEHNTITDNPSDGVLAFEYPNPFPPTKQTIYFQLSGNKIADNEFSGNGGLGGPYSGDVAMEGGQFGSKESTNNCLTGNTFADATYPANIEGTWGCQNAKTPNGVSEFSFVEYLLELQGESEARKPEPQPAPGEQPTMPDPCWEVPQDQICP